MWFWKKLCSTVIGSNVGAMERCGYNKKAFGALVTDLFKVFDLLSRELIIAKLNAYGFSFLH